MVFKVPSNSIHSMVLWLYDSMNLVLSGISPLCNDKQAFKMIDHFSYICFHLLFAVHIKIAFYSQGEKKKEFLWKPVKAVPAPPYIASYLAVGRALLIPKGRVSERSVIQPSTGWAWEHSAARHRPLNKKPCCVFPRQPQSVLTFICRALGNSFCQTNQKLLLNVEGYLQIRLDLAPSRLFCQIK